MTLPIAIIVAVAENGIIGNDGDMPWKLSSDLKRFKAITTGNPIIMGRKTFESIGRPLPNRHNIVISRNQEYSPDGVTVVSSVDKAVLVAQKWGEENASIEICILGGGEIYRQFIDQANLIYYTGVMANPSGDTSFPAIDQNIWMIKSEELIPSGPKDTFDTKFTVFHRK